MFLKLEVWSYRGKSLNDADTMFNHLYEMRPGNRKSKAGLLSYCHRKRKVFDETDSGRHNSIKQEGQSDLGETGCRRIRCQAVTDSGTWRAGRLKSVQASYRIAVIENNKIIIRSASRGFWPADESWQGFVWKVCKQTASTRPNPDVLLLLWPERTWTH